MSHESIMNVDRGLQPESGCGLLKTGFITWVFSRVEENNVGACGPGAALRPPTHMGTSLLANHRGSEGSGKCSLRRGISPSPRKGRSRGATPTSFRTVVRKTPCINSCTCLREYIHNVSFSDKYLIAEFYFQFN